VADASSDLFEGASAVLAAPPPRIDERAASQVARQLFGVDGDATQLGSERDQHFVIASSETRAVLKVSNTAEDRSVLEMQCAAALHVAHHDQTLPVQIPLRALDGQYVAETTTAAGARCFVRLLAWVDGSEVEASELSFDALAPIGSCSARVARALRGFFHPAAGRPLLWDLRHVPGLRRLVENVADPTRRSLVESVLDRYDERVTPAFSALRAQVIHNDLSLGNVLVDGDGRVTGILDFGDMVHTALIGELVATTVSLMQGRPDPFESATAVMAGFSSITPLEADEAELLPDLIASRLATTVTVSAWRVRRMPENETYITGWDRDSWELLELFDEIGEVEVRRRLTAARRTVRQRPLTARNDDLASGSAPDGSLIARRHRVLGADLSPLSYSRPIHVVRGEGVWMFDADGRAYLDAYNNVPIVGHCHPYVTDEIARQSSQLSTNTRYLYENVVALAERLTASMPDPLDTCIFVNSGSEANDLAWRLATARAEAGGAIVTANAYHGISSATHALSPEDWAAGEHHLHVAQIAAPDGYRGSYREDDTPDWAERYAMHVRSAAERLASHNVSLAMTMVDTTLTSDGIFAPPARWFQAAAQHTHEAGGVYVADEVQVGFGRSGSALWGFATSGIVPEIVTLGKPMGNGYPVAAVVTSRELAGSFTRGHELFSTFGGNPVACAAALAVLDVIEREGLQGNAATVGDHLRSGLASLAERHPLIGEVRGIGLLIGVELVGDPRRRSPASGSAATIADMMRDRGVLVGSTGPDDNVLKIRPPLVFGVADADLLLGTLDEVLTVVVSTGST
jgi:4-aminobutyrate aminotransferase-like enzyme